MRYFVIPYLVTILVAGLLCLGLRLAYPADRFVALIEQSVGMRPGQTKVLPACGCTIRYMGTSGSGRHYVVRIDRLD
jgi:hypothetical protein